MGHRKPQRHSGVQPPPVPASQPANAPLHQAIHRSVLAHFNRTVPDPDHPGQQIAYGDLEQRLRGRCYRRALAAAAGGPSHLRA